LRLKTWLALVEDFRIFGWVEKIKNVGKVLEKSENLLSF